MKLKISSLAVLSFIAFGCHAPAHRGLKNSGDLSANNKKAVAANCDLQGTFLNVVKSKHPDLTGLLIGQMNPMLFTNSVSAFHVVATFGSAIAASTPVPAPSPDPSPEPSPAVTVNDEPVASASPATSPAAVDPQGIVASGFLDSSCNVIGYVEASVTPDLGNSVTSCEDPAKSMGKEGENKAFALMKYDSSFKSPYEAQLGVSVFEVYSLGTDDKLNKTMVRYLFDQQPCHVDFPERTILIDPNAPTVAKEEKGGS